MRVLVFGDVHGNLLALEKLFKIEEGNYDEFICHGDIVNYGPWQNECIDFLNVKGNGIFLRGNHEEYYIDGKYPGENEVAKSFFEFCFPKFESKHIETISSFKSMTVVGDFHVKHSIDGLYIFDDTLLSDNFISDNTIIGHSHQQFHRTINGKSLYNTGSLGQNRSFLNIANYLIIDLEKSNVELKYFVFDINLVISKMNEMKYPSICLNYYKSKKKINNDEK